ncbi:MAG: hypothetical protein IKB97_08220, partial [Bacteroidaceae bacterium]|nr:hypothetical protein [Bacteroidaceae bacterium]
TKTFQKKFSKKVFSVEVQDLNFVSAFQLICVSLSKAGAKVLLYNISTKHSKHFFANFLHPFT